MTTLKKIISSLTAAALMALSLASCDNPLSGSSSDYICPAFDADSTEPANLVVILGLNANMPVPDISSLATGGDTFGYICSHGGSVQAVVADGCPRNNLGENFTITAPDRKAYTASNYNKIIKQASASVKSGFTADLAPKVGETSPIDAIITASELLRSKEGQKYLAIYHSGIITESYGSMTHLDFDVKTAIDCIKANEAIPDLTGIRVDWFGMTNVCGDQEAMTEINKKNLRQFWTEYFALTGATFTIKGEAYNKVVMPDESYPKTRPVTVGRIILPGEEISDEKELPRFPDEGSFSFTPNTAEFKDPIAAQRDIQPFVKYMNETDEDVVLIGTTATVGASDSAIALSKERSEAIKALLVNEGIAESRIQAFGAGYSDDDFHVQDRDGSGELIESSAKLNRSVYAISVSDRRAAKYLN